MQFGDDEAKEAAIDAAFRFDLSDCWACHSKLRGARGLSSRSTKSGTSLEIVSYLTATFSTTHARSHTNRAALVAGNQIGRLTKLDFGV